MKIGAVVYPVSFTGKSENINPGPCRNDLGIRTVKYSEPVSLRKALVDIKNDASYGFGIISRKRIVESFLNDLEKKKELLETKIVNVSGYGTRAIAFETKDGDILKITRKNHFPKNRPQEHFDVPIFIKGHKGKTYYYLEEKLSQKSLPDNAAEYIQKQIESLGYKTFDFSAKSNFQIGKDVCGKLYLLDPECARSKNVFHTIFRRILKLIKV